jgi:hypothetical protein
MQKPPSFNLEAVKAQIQETLTPGSIVKNAPQIHDII